MMRRLTGLLLAIAMLTALAPVGVFAEGEEERLTYKSSENFSTDSGDGTWDNGVWVAQTVDPETDTYTPMQYAIDGRYYATDGTNDQYVSGDSISPPTNGRYSTESLRTHWAARTFVAPRDGMVTVSCVEDRITPGDSSYPKVRIRYESNGSFTELLPEKKLSWSGQNTVQGTYNLTITQGDKIHFEILRTKEYSYLDTDGVTVKYNGCYPNVYWDPIITYAEDAGEVDPPVIPDDKERYQSSESFAVTSGDGTWDNGIWTANVINTDTGEYSAITTTNKANDKWENSNGVYIDADEITPVIGGDVTATYTYLGGAKTFTAPKDGYVQISYAEIVHGNDSNLVYGVMKYAWNQGLKFRVRHQTADGVSTIYPTNGDYLENAKDAHPYMIAADTVTNTVEIKQGDKLHFEVMRLVKNNAWQGIYCDPIIKYIDESELPPPPPADEDDPAKTVYTSSESFNLEKNGNYAWKWQCYDINTREYKNLTHTHDTLAGFGLGDTNAPGWYLPAATDYNKHLGVAVGEYGMRVSINEPDDVATDAEKAGELERNVAVKAFTAPKRGSVTISTNVFEPGHTNGGAALRIIKHSADGTQTKLYPTDADWINIYAGDTFAPITTEIENGDILTFENALWKNNSAWQAIIRWDPVITYTKLLPTLEECNTELGATDVPLNKEHILTYSAEVAAPAADNIKIYEVAADGTKTESDAAVKSITANGKDLKIVLGGLKEYQEYEVEIGGVAYAATPNDTAANTLKFTTGPVVNVGAAEYADGKVTVAVNNSAAAPAKAALATFLCKGTESSYTIESVRIVTRTDIGANDSMEVALTLPTGDYFIKALVLEDAKTARAYAPITILKGDN